MILAEPDPFIQEEPLSSIMVMVLIISHTSRIDVKVGDVIKPVISLVRLGLPATGPHRLADELVRSRVDPQLLVPPMPKPD